MDAVEHKKRVFVAMARFREDTLAKEARLAGRRIEPEKCPVKLTPMERRWGTHCLTCGSPISSHH